MYKRHRSLAVTFVGYGLACVFGFGLITYFLGFIFSVINPELIIGSPLYVNRFENIFDFQIYAFLISLLIYAPLCIGYLAILTLSDRARQFVIFMNAVMCFVFIIRIFLTSGHDALAIASACLAVLMIIFFRQPKIEEQFRFLKIKFVGKTILVVDDDRGFLKMVSAILLSRGYRPLGVPTGEAGLKMAKTQKPDLIILDVILPGMKGRQICSLLKEDPKTRDIPVIFLTAKDSSDDIDAEMKAGAVAHFTKPFDPHILLDEIQKVLGV